MAGNGKTGRVFPALPDLIIALKGGGDLATGVALTLFRAGLRQIYILETLAPTVIRQKAAFATAVFETKIQVEGIRALRTEAPEQIREAWANGEIPVVPDPCWATLSALPPHVLVDAILAKKNLGTRKDQAPLVLGLGPGFTAGQDVHIVIETLRGHELGRLISQGPASANTSTPEAVLGITQDRVIRAPGTGEFSAACRIGDMVSARDVLGRVAGMDVITPIAGVVRGLIRNRLPVTQGQKIGDVDPRAEARYCTTVSDKARALGGAVLTAILGACHG